MRIDPATYTSTASLNRPMPANGPFSLLLTVVLAVGGSLMLYRSPWLFDNLLLHAAIEVSGSLSMLLMACAMLMQIAEPSHHRSRLWTACSLICMGMLTGAHSCLPPGKLFVWFICASNLAGGLIGNLNRLPLSKYTMRHARQLPWLLAVVVAAVIVFSFLYPDMVPAMLVNDGFTPLAQCMNVGAALLLFSMMVRHIGNYRKSGRLDELLFANFFLLLTFSSLLFPFSHVWNGVWWYWHLLRLGASLMVFVGLLLTVQSSNQVLRRSRAELQDLVDKKTHDIAELLEFNQQAIDHSPIGIGVYHENGNCLRVNHALEAIIGGSTMEMLGQNFQRIESWKRNGMDVCAHQALRTQTVVTLQTEISTSFGKNVWLECSFSTFHSDDQLRLLLTAYDITKIKEAEAALEQLSRHDPLTGVLNRRGLGEVLEREWQASVRTQSPLSLIMIDIDLFKQFNDRYGHQDGDRCLTQVATAIRDMLPRSRDIVARYGGEEFIVLLPSTDNAGALQVGEKLRQGILALAIPHADSGHAQLLTISQGVATTIAEPGQSVEHLITRADGLLYQAKAQGRNCLCSDS